MDNIKKKIINKIENNGSATVADLVFDTSFSRAYIHRAFKELVDDGKISKIGNTKSAQYVSPKDASIDRDAKLKIDLRLLNVALSEDGVLKRIKNETGILINIKRNVSRIIDYAFTEMCNNAIEHSQGENIRATMTRLQGKIIFNIYDDGVGIYENIKDIKKLKSTIEAVQDLLKGKQTTMPSAHSGEGIFFTSRLADKLIIFGNGHKLIFDNIIGDVFLEDDQDRRGTRVYFELGTDSKKEITEVFEKYTDKETYKFDKTEVKIKLYIIDTEYISRSQARRVLTGINKFNTAVLDFDKVNTVGQGFADEIFRIWAQDNPGKKITYINANKEVEFMIERARQHE